ncbi:MAG TPA: ThiF family adenylyltransferase [Actinocrinis sp.]|nr:ThiF family adenylyltransferase [Actinocrinis sp.]
MRPVLKAALAPLWLDPHTLRLGSHPAQSLTYRLGPGHRALIDALDGARDLDGLLDHADRLGPGRAEALATLERFARDGALDDADRPRSTIRPPAPAELARIASDLAALGLRHRLPGGGQRAWERRGQRCVQVLGLGRVGTVVARSLAACGIGTVVPVDPLPVGHGDLGPGGYRPRDLGRRRQDATCEAIRDLTPDVRTAGSYRPWWDLAVVAPADRHPVDLLLNLTRDGTAHLLVETWPDRAGLGPLVIPDRSPCTHCRDLARSEQDPGWPLVLAQLGRTDRPGLRNGDTMLSALVAAQAVLHALAYLDGAAPPSVNGCLEYPLPFGEPVRFDLAFHPACGCAALPLVFAD